MTQEKKREDLLRSALLMTGATYINYATGIVVSLLIARHLGPVSYGQYAYLVWLSGLMVLLFNGGTAITAITYVSERLGRQDRQGARVVHDWLKRRRIYSIAVITLAFFAALPWIKPSGWQGQLVLFAGLVLVSALTKSSYIFAISVAKGYGRFSVEAIISNLLSIGTLAAVGIAALLNASLLHYALLFVTASCLHMLLASRLLRSEGIAVQAGDLPEEVRTRIKHHLTWTTLMLAVIAFGGRTVETFMLNHLAGAQDVGFFLIAAALTKGGIDLLSSGFNSVLMSHMAHAYGAQGEDAVNTVLSNNLRYAHFLGLMLAGVGFFMAKPVIALLYGQQYLPAVPLMQILVVAGGLALAEGVFGARLSTTGAQQTRTLIVAVTLVVSIIGAALLVTRYGVLGAAVSSAITSIVGLCTIGLYTARRARVRLPYKALVANTALACSAALPGAALLLASSNVIAWIAAAVLFAVVYIGLSLLLHLWTKNDLEGVANILRRVPGLKARTLNLARWGR
jgi:O-antigen/teichoic acid export membrane protein